MSIVYVPENFLRESWIKRRNKIFNAMLSIGYDYAVALEVSRQETDWEYRDWRTHESQIQCDVQKDYDDQRDGDWTR